MNYYLRFSLFIIFIFLACVPSVGIENNTHPELNNHGHENSIDANAPTDNITATITGTTSVCLNSVRPLITFTGTGGTAPYSFVYQINNKPDTTITTTSGNIITVSVPTNVTGPFAYTLKKVKDANSSLLDVTGTATITVNALPVVNFSFTNDNTCPGTSIQFTPSLTGAYTYTWDFDDKSNSTDSNPSHAFVAIGDNGTQIFKVKLTIKDNSTGCQNTVTKNVTVLRGPDPSLDPGNNGSTTYDPVQKVFVNCTATKSSPQFDFMAVNASTTTLTNTSYDIDWGDGNTNKLNTFTNLSHRYQTLGFFDIKLSVTNSKTGCSSSKTYKFFNGNSPGGSLNNIANTVDCAPFTVTWPVIGTQDNAPGTTYKISVDDGSPDQTYTQTTLPDSISHNFTTSSCDKPTNKFTITFSIFNPCNSSEPTLQVQATQKPKADFDINSGSNFNVCLNNRDTLKNTSVGSYAIGSSCLTNFDVKWSISPNTGWTGTLTNSDVNTLVFNKVGDYNVKLKIKIPKSSDSRCTSDSITKTIHVNPLPTATISGGATVCKGAPSPEITFIGANGSAPYTFTYNINNGLSQTVKANVGNSTTIKAPTSIAGTFTYTLLSVQEGSTSGCSQLQTGTAVIIIDPLPTVTFSSTDQTICSGESTAAVNLTSTTAGADLSWSTLQPSGISEPLLLSGTNTIPAQTFTNTTNAPISVIYNAKASQSGVTPCVGVEYPYTIIINPRPVVSVSLKDTICSGSAFSFSPINGGGNTIPAGTKYTWSTPTISPSGAITGASGQNVPQSVISQKLVNVTSTIPTATYSVTPIVNGCPGSPFNVLVSVNQKTTVDKIDDKTLCDKEQNAKIVFSGNIPGTQYKWSTNNVNIGMAGTSGYDSIPAFTAISTGTSPITAIITVTPTYGSGNSSCDGTVQFSITVNPTGQVNIPGNFNACNEQLNSVIYSTNITGGVTTYAWTNSNTNMGIGNSGNGNISFTPISIGDAVLTSIITVIPTFTNNGVSCDGAPEQFTITVNPLVIKIISQTDIKCNGESTGAVSIDVQGGFPIEVAPGIFDYKYVWTGPNGFTSSKKNLDNIPAGNYTLTVTDNPGCIQAFSVVMKEPAPIIVSASTTPISYDGANDASIQLTISGGIPPYQTQWDNLASGTFQGNLSAGDYIITVTDANNCRKAITVSIQKAPVFRVSPIVKNVSCYGAHDGSITLNLEGGQEPITLSWSDNSTSGTTRNNIGPGTYTVNIRDAGTYVISRTFEIIEPLPIELTAYITNILDCTIENGGAIDLSAIGGAIPYTYAWSNGATTEDLANIPAGKYLVTVTDINGCKQTAEYEVKRPAPIEINVITKINYDCASKKIKAICSAEVTGGVPPYQLSWSLGAVSGSNNEIMETEYSNMVVLKVTDTSVCQVNKTFNIDIPVLGIDYQLLNCDQHAYQFNAGVVDEQAQYTFSWDFGDGTGSNIKNPQHTYSVSGNKAVRLTVLDSTGSCVSEYEKSVFVEFPPVVALDRIPKFCEGDSLLVHAMGANTYRWNDGTFGDSILIKQSGDYTVIGFSKAGCSDTLNFTASYFDKMNYTIQSDKTEVTTDQTQLHLWTENIPFSNYTWDFGDGSNGHGYDIFHTYIPKDGNFDIKLKVINSRYALF